MSHLPVLMAMFPEKVFLTVEDIARLLNLSKGHIYNLSSAKTLPFKLDDHSDKIQVSIVAMAKYLDSKLETPNASQEAQPVPTLIKKRGRPRGATRTQITFQSHLSLAIIREEIVGVFNQVEDQLEALIYEDNEKSCSEKFDDAKSEFSLSIKTAKSSIFHSLLQVGLPVKAESKLPIEKI